MGHPAPVDDGFEVLESAPRRVSRRVQLILFAVVTVLGAVIAVHLLSADNHSERITVYGQPVADPGAVLASAQQRFAGYAAGRHGTLGKDATCWFQLPADSADIASALLCGPVLFYDDDPDAPYLSFPLVVRGNENPVRLDAAGAPASPDPAAAPDGVTLVRPERTMHPLASAGFAAPVPPPASANTLAMTDEVHPENLVHAAADAVIGADRTTVRLDAYGPINNFGSGSAERSAPDGRELFAFRLVFGGGENGFALLSHVDLRVSVGNGAPRSLHLPDNSVTDAPQLFVVATPVTAPLELVLTEHGITQRLSLRNGAPAAANIDFLRENRPLYAVPFAGSTPVTVTVAARTRSTRLYISLVYAGRMFFVPGSGEHPSATDHVFLWLDLRYGSSLISGTSGYAPTAVTLTPRGGEPVRSRRVDGSDVPLFDVPADMTYGTLTVGGVEIRPGHVVPITPPAYVPLRLAPDDH